MKRAVQDMWMAHTIVCVVPTPTPLRVPTAGTAMRSPNRPLPDRAGFLTRATGPSIRTPRYVPPGVCLCVCVCVCACVCVCV